MSIYVFFGSIQLVAFENNMTQNAFRRLEKARDGIDLFSLFSSFF